MVFGHFAFNNILMGTFREVSFSFLTYMPIFVCFVMNSEILQLCALKGNFWGFKKKIFSNVWFSNPCFNVILWPYL